MSSAFQASSFPARWIAAPARDRPSPPPNTEPFPFRHQYIPQDVSRWLAAQSALGGDAVGSACCLLERELAAGISFMNANGLLHFDAHFGNILTDGSRLYFADFGQVLPCPP
ncbi:hypothetical protein [Streptosporangium sp. NPDC000396]|uniref:hypothetical protein n=1 Tax=Streptosporangium sp. NPDC000396 TaxID=3366185 RepID=UPI0036872057